MLPFCCFFDLTVLQADFSFSFSFLLHTSDQELVVFLPQEKILSESTLFLYSFLTLLQWGEGGSGWNLATPDWPPVGAAQGPPTTSDGAVDQHRQDTWVHLKGQRLTALTGVRWAWSDPGTRVHTKTCRSAPAQWPAAGGGPGGPHSCGPRPGGPCPARWSWWTTSSSVVLVDHVPLRKLLDWPGPSGRDRTGMHIR